MNAGTSRAPDRKPGDNMTDTGNGAPKTPGADMQPEDAGTAESGNTGRGTAADGVLKQTGRTGEDEPGKG